MTGNCGCRKRLYRRQTEAYAVAIYQSGKTGKALRVYACPTQTGWHLTSRPLREEDTT